MNQFKFLDKIFPCGSERTSGEVVSVLVDLQLSSGFNLGKVEWKRKAWYVNASTNAFILHRKLCKQLAENLSNSGLSQSFSKNTIRKTKVLLAIAVKQSYCINHADGKQYHEWLVQFEFNEDGKGVISTPSLWNNMVPGYEEGCVSSQLLTAWTLWARTK